MTEQTGALRVCGATRRFGGVAAVRQVDMALPSGQITGLIGPNGAGKTTLVGLISGLLRLTEGGVFFGERDISRLQPDAIARLGIARTFQNIRLFGDLTVLENVMIPLIARRRGLTSSATARRAAIEALELTGLSSVASRVAAGLPYGHQRLVEMARALAMKPAVLLLDEPVAGMTDGEADGVQSFLNELRGRGLTILLIEHNVGFVMRCCDSIYVLQNGMILAHGTASDVRNDQRVIDAYLGR